MDIKFNCINPNCRQRIAVDESKVGYSVVCPVCAAVQQVPSSTDIRFSCSNPDCGQHIVVDMSEAGRFVRCPSCNKPLQVPGIPKKSLLYQSIGTYGKQSVLQLVVEVPPRMPFSPLKRLIYGWGIGVVILIMLIAGFGLRSWVVLPGHFNEIVGEICSVGEFRNAPLSNFAGTKLIYARNVENGGSIFLADLQTGKSQQLMNQQEGATMDFENVLGWSPDNRYLLVPLRNNPTQLSHQLAVCEGDDGSFLKFITLPAAAHEVVWLNTNTLVVLTHSARFCLVNLDSDSSLNAFGKKGVVNLKQPQLDRNNKGHHWPTRISDREIAYIDGGNVWKLNLLTGKYRQLSHFTNSTLEWLDYNPSNKTFLFNLTDNGNNKGSSLYCFNPDDATDNGLTPVTVSRVSSNGVIHTPVVHALKGQWALNGQGIAFVKDTLIIESEDTNLSTNLFVNGHVQSYSVSPDRKKIYTLAATNSEPLSLWEYDIADQELRNVVPATERQFIFSRVVDPVGVAFTDQSINKFPELIKTLAYKCVPPVNLDAHKKYPAVIHSPRDSRWAPDAQVFANAGIYCVYAPSAASLPGAGNLSPQAQAVLATYYEVLKNPNVDSHRIYLIGYSAETEKTLTELIQYNPDFWRGALFMSPTSFPEIPREAQRYPSIFISTGEEDKDEYKDAINKFVQVACQRTVPIRVNRLQHSGHILASTKLLEERYAATAKFILENY